MATTQAVPSFAAGTGRRKTATAQVRLVPGSGKVTVNRRELKDYFLTEAQRGIVLQPFVATSTREKFDTAVTVKGGGPIGQAGAVRHGIARALIEADASLRGTLKAEGLLTRDPRKRERKKYGQPGARKRFQFSKR
jgi:small subunit ribosomal protein S9